MRESKVCLILALFVIATLCVDAKPEPEPRGRKRAFGVGLFGGALAGGVIGNVMAKQSARPAPPAKHVTVIETSQPLSNGCYKQTIKEPLPHDPHVYVETVNLICPTVTTPAPSPAEAAAAAAAAAKAPSLLPWSNSNASEAVPMMPQPAPLYPVLPDQAHQPNATKPALSNAPVPGSAHQLQPVAAAAAAPTPASPQVIVLSKKAIYYNKKKRNAANTLTVNLLLTALTFIAVHL